ncbi:MAG: GntR family transcriptional regulator [Victivallaceae bacterium]|nr:GntR family transcriptional regulator [Victivallaceae bacterium]
MQDDPTIEKPFFTPEELQMSGTRRLAGYYRNRILSGALPVGEKLPPTLRLAELFDMSTANVQRALLSLVREGLIRRIPHRGTVVAGNYQKFRCAAILLHIDFRAGLPVHQRALTERLIRQLHLRDYEGIVLFDDLQAPFLDRLRTAIRKFDIQGPESVK